MKIQKQLKYTNVINDNYRDNLLLSLLLLLQQQQQRPNSKTPPPLEPKKRIKKRILSTFLRSNSNTSHNSVLINNSDNSNNKQQPQIEISNPIDFQHCLSVKSTPNNKPLLNNNNAPSPTSRLKAFILNTKNEDSSSKRDHILIRNNQNENNNQLVLSAAGSPSLRFKIISNSLLIFDFIKWTLLTWTSQVIPR
jgi:hypothetical protein